ncbi:hypothetical protein [Streptomyces sp. NPDC017868]
MDRADTGTPEALCGTDLPLGERTGHGAPCTSRFAQVEELA